MKIGIELSKQNGLALFRGNLAIVFCVYIFIVLTPFVHISADIFEVLPFLNVNNDCVEVNFSLNEYKDVAAEVLDESGVIIRHLGAGVLGTNVPLPFQSNTKTQKIIWDWKDDKGNAMAQNGNYRILVKAGMEARFGSIIGWDGQWLGIIMGMAVDENGNLFVNMVSRPIIHRCPVNTKVFDRDGNYLRSLLPFPGDLDVSKRQGLKEVTDSESRTIPFLYNPYNWSVLPGFGIDLHQPVLSKDSMFIFPVGLIDHQMGSDMDVDGPRLASVGIDGSVGADYIKQKIAYPEPPYEISKTQSHHIFPRVFLCISPSGRYIYASGIVASYCYPDYRASLDIVKRIDHVVYRIDLESEEQAHVFIGEKWASGNDAAHLNNPLGIDVDPDGNIYVCDRGNNRIAIFDSLGNFLNALPVQYPVHVAFHPKTRKIYVHCAQDLADGASVYGTVPHQIIRLSGKNDATPEITIEYKENAAYLARVAFAFDKVSDPPVIWLGSFNSNSGHMVTRGNIIKILDRGSYFEDLGDVITSKSPVPLLGMSHQYVNVDSRTEEVWWDDMMFDGNTGELKGIFQIKNWRYGLLAKGEPKFGPDNSVIVRHHNEENIERYSRLNGSPYPFLATGTHVIKDIGLHSGGGTRPRGFDVSESGDIYILHHLAQRDRGNTQVSIIGPDGTVKQDKFIRIESACGGIAVDRKGAIYIGAHLKPFGIKIPVFFDDFFKNNADDAYIGLGTKMLYEKSTGSLLKFGSDGGAILPDAMGKDYQVATKKDVMERPRYKSTGVLWSKFANSSQQTTAGGCVCETNRHDVDMHNRIYLPDPLTYSIWVYDENGNKITRFGDYGNMDSRGPGSQIPTPEIPFSYPLGVAVSDKAAYINDIHAHRVVRVNLAYSDIGFADIGTVIADSKNCITFPKSILNFTNPFNAGGIIRNFLPHSDGSRIVICDVRGRLVRQFNIFKSGKKPVTLLWNGCDESGHRVPCGTYIIRLQNFQGKKTYLSRKMVLF
ncbi:MAG: hypothetical protein ABIA63_01820 [bacterium]